MEFKRRSLFLISIFIFFIYTTNHAQLPNENGSGSWLEIYGNNKISNDWSIPIVGILRHHDMLEKYDFSFVRGGISYQLTNSSTLTGGVAFLSSKNYTDTHKTTKANQYWVYEQFTLKSRFKRNTIAHRWRLENRWIKDAKKIRFNNRFRYRLQFVRPLYNDTYVRAFNEIFLSLNNSFFNQNRFYIGFGQIVSPSFQIDLGYLKNHFKHTDRDFVRISVTFKTNFLTTEIAEHDR
ncbi:DUF2490 domain-containing protein [Flagellimonas pacifica]|uniref:DUF2490 domain-containing protein n=1 Tax=Flagellimonas pacifica TaxID=1247520 RepID=A0A285MVA3_9FLAO|nr:DUF2490 domain-containing protein [Allomuricauda parva]SNZ01129.1 Protein of unknown function [Allomuricauda parva]